MDVEEADGFGVALAMADDLVLAGAPGHDELGFEAGAAYIFWRDGNETPEDPTDDTWVQQTRLAPADLGALDVFGFSVSISADLAVVGAPGLYGDVGAAYVFRREDNGTPADPSDDLWIEEAKLTAAQQPS